MNIQLHKKARTTPEVRREIQAMDPRVYGSDILSLPARKPDGGWGFVCLECGLVG